MRPRSKRSEIEQNSKVKNVKPPQVLVSASTARMGERSSDEKSGNGKFKGLFRDVYQKKYFARKFLSLAFQK